MNTEKNLCMGVSKTKITDENGYLIPENPEITKKREMCRLLWKLKKIKIEEDEEYKKMKKMKKIIFKYNSRKNSENTIYI